MTKPVDPNKPHEMGDPFDFDILTAEQMRQKLKEKRAAEKTKKESQKHFLKDSSNESKKKGEV